MNLLPAQLLTHDGVPGVQCQDWWQPLPAQWQAVAREREGAAVTLGCARTICAKCRTRACEGERGGDYRGINSAAP